MVLALTEKLGSLFLIMMVGFVITKTGLLKPADSKTISKVVIFVLLPCSVIRAFNIRWDATMRDRLLVCLAGALLLNVVMILFSRILGKVFHLNAAEEGSVGYSNAGNIVIPLVTAMFGPEMVIYTSPFIAVQLFFLWSHGNYLISGEKKIHFKKMLLNVNLIAVYIGCLLLVTGVQLPAMVRDTMDSLGTMVGPASMLATGMLMGDSRIWKFLHRPGLYKAVAFRLIVVPAVCLGCLKAMTWVLPEGDWKAVLMIVFLACMTPPANTITQMAQIYDREPEYCGLISVMTMILCIGTMPLMVWVFERVIG